MIIRQLTLLGALLAGLLVMAAGGAKAQDKVKIAVPTTISISTASQQVVFTGISGPTLEFENCADFSGMHERRTGIVVDPDIPPAGIITAVYPDVVLPAGTHVINLRLDRTCSQGAFTFRIYEGTIASPKTPQWPSRSPLLVSL